MAKQSWDSVPVVRDRRQNEREQAETRYRNTTGDANPLAQPVILPGEEGYAGPGEFLPDAGVVVRKQPWEEAPIVSQSELDERQGVEIAAQAGVLNVPGLNPFVRGAIEQAPFLDEGIDALTALGTGSSFSDARRRRQMIGGYDRENNGLERNLGGIAGFTAGLAAPGGAYIAGAQRGAQVGRAAAVGAGYGAAYGGGAAEGGYAERLTGAGIGAATGAVGGAALQRGAQSFAQRLGGITGGNPAPRPMAARVADFDRVGVDPMLAGVGGPLQQRAAQTLGGNLMTGGPIIRGAERTREQTIAAVDDIAGRYGAAPDRDSAGGILRRGAQGGADRLKQETGAVYEPVNALEANTTPIPLTNSQTAISESLSLFTTPELRNWFTRKATDLSEFEGLLQSTNGQASFAEARRLRSIVGQMMDDPEVFRSQSQAGLSRLYAALSDDITEGARMIGGDEAARQVERAGTYYSAARTRADDVLKQFYGSTTDAEAYNRLVARAQTAGNRSSWQQVRQLRDSLTPEEWGDIGSGVIRTLGQKGDDFSVGQFATNWEKMTPEARRILFGGQGRTELFQDLQALARVAQTQQRAGRFYNSSESGNTIGNQVGIGASAATGLAALGGNVAPLAMLVSGGLIGNGISRLLTSPGVARWLAGTTSQAVPQAQRLARANPAFAEFWNANREAITRLVAQNDNVSGLPAAVAAQEEEPEQ